MSCTVVTYFLLSVYLPSTLAWTITMITKIFTVYMDSKYWGVLMTSVSLPISKHTISLLKDLWKTKVE